MVSSSYETLTVVGNVCGSLIVSLVRLIPSTQVLGIYPRLFIQQNQFNIRENVRHSHLLQIVVIHPSLFTETVPQVIHQSISIHHRHPPRSSIQSVDP